jgi:hypothetical protein
MDVTQREILSMVNKHGNKTQGEVTLVPPPNTTCPPVYTTDVHSPPAPAIPFTKAIGQ